MKLRRREIGGLRAAWMHALGGGSQPGFTGRALVFKLIYLRAPWELVGRMDIRESLWKYSKSIGDVYGDLGAANRVGIVWIFFHDWIFFFIQTGKSTTQIRVISELDIIFLDLEKCLQTV